MPPESLKAGPHRYERKFHVSVATPQEAELAVAHHPAMFREIYHQRFVNNIYLDSPGLGSYIDNVDGVAARAKVRIRWYGELFGAIDAPILEFKIKEGCLGMKESFALQPFVLDSNFDVQTLQDVVDSSGLPEPIAEALKALSPVLLNRYSRKYFLSANGNYRVTVDTDLTSYRIGRYNNSFLHRATDRHHVIVELKYDKEMDDDVDRISSLFPFRVTKSSKYVSGVDEIHSW